MSDPELAFVPAILKTSPTADGWRVATTTVLHCTENGRNAVYIGQVLVRKSGLSIELRFVGAFGAFAKEYLASAKQTGFDLIGGGGRAKFNAVLAEKRRKGYSRVDSETGQTDAEVRIAEQIADERLDQGRSANLPKLHALIEGVPGAL